MIVALIVIFALFCLPFPIHAVYDPLSVPNNRYGIHIADTNDIRDAARLVNSTDGDWGYVTLVIPENDRNVGKWQELMNLMRRLHLIPIVRLATHVEGSTWVKPQEVDAGKWADFLNSLTWPVENRYVVLFNEPNHANEWGGSLDPEQYVMIARSYAKALKNTSKDFFILPAGLDSAASSDGKALDAAEYLKRMWSASPEFFSLIDGWTSHSYPNPGFSASPYATGKGSIKSFDWELKFLSSLGLSRRLPIFITETGWIHGAGKFPTSALMSPESVGQQLKTAALFVWSDPRIVAVTPFVLNYQDLPFDRFSFKKLNSSEFYAHFAAYQSIAKTKGNPNQYESVTPEKPLLPDKLVVNSTYTLKATVKNTGQGIIDPNLDYELTVVNPPQDFTFLSEPVPYLEPGESGTFVLHVKTPTIEQTQKLEIVIRHGTKATPLDQRSVAVIPPPNIQAHLTLGWRKEHSAKGVTILLYDDSDILLHKFQDIEAQNGVITATGLYNMIPGNTYRLVVLVPYYLPRQQLVTLGDTTTKVQVKRFFPLDFNGDGALNSLDIPAMIFTKPRDVWSRFF